MLKLRPTFADDKRYRLQPVKVLASVAFAVLATAATAGTCQNNLPPVNPDSAYTLYGNGIVVDNRTGLHWKRCTEGMTWNGSTCAGTPTSLTWTQALALAESHSFVGHVDWRLPSIKELKSLVETCRVDPSINDTVFAGTPSTWVWSGSPDASFSSNAWPVYFRFGSAFPRARSESYQVRLVRGGQ
jgi:hypothetical protein